MEVVESVKSEANKYYQRKTYVKSLNMVRTLNLLVQSNNLTVQKILLIIINW